MIDGLPVVAWTPYGRESTYSILVKYLERDHAAGLIDEAWLCINVDLHGQEGDLRYAYRLAREFPWIKIVDRPVGMPRRHPKQRNTGYFYQSMTDPDTTYVRFDDDIVYVHPAAVERLVRSARQRPETVASFPVMWNNSIISWFAQQSGIIPEAGMVKNPGGYVWPKVGGPYCMDGVGWADGKFAVQIHDLLLTALEDKGLAAQWQYQDLDPLEKFFFYQDFPVQLGTQFSVSVFASLGKMYAGLPRPGVLVPDEEEHWHTVHQPRVLGQPNVIVGDALVSHYTFNPQRRIVMASNTLDRYRALADKL
jgi:hypothetical protein